MSAIFGLMHTDGQSVSPVDLELMDKALSAHGSDGGGIWKNENLGLGQRLMCLTPEDLFERQPLISTDGRRVLVSAARIDNRPELIRELAIPTSEAREL